MEHILLSLLVLRGMTIYEIRAYVQQKLSAICSDSLGSIQAGLKKLLEKGYIEAGAYTENNVRKKRYTVTPAGVAFYKEWIGSPINIAKMKTMEEGKFFFLGMAPREKRVAFLRQYIGDLQAEYEKLRELKHFTVQNQKAVIQKSTELICRDGTAADNLRAVSGEQDTEKTVRSIYAYQMYLLEHGLHSAEAELRFYEKILRKELEG